MDLYAIISPLYQINSKQLLRANSTAKQLYRSSFIFMTTALEIKNLHVSAGDQPILKGIDLLVKSGETHALMGPNGSGKSTLAYTLAGHPAYEPSAGQVIFNGQDLLEMEADERARAGLFLAFQYPAAVPGVTLAKFLRQTINSRRQAEDREAGSR